MSAQLPEEQSKLLWAELLQEAENMAPLPEVAQRIIHEIENPNSTPKDFESIIRNDPALTLKILKMANSAFYGYRKHIDTITQAIVILGLNTLRSIVVAASAYASLSRSISGYGIEAEIMYRMGLASAVAAETLCKKVKFREKEKAFVGALLHDLGKILLGTKIKPYIPQIIALTQQENIPFNIAERKILGFNQNDVGAELAKKWDLPSFIIDSCQFYHSPESCTTENKPVVEVVHVADLMMHSLKLSTTIDSGKYPVSKKVLFQFHMNEQEKISMIRELKKSYNEILSALNE